MIDISARELKGHNILAIERFQNSTKWMIEFVVTKDNVCYGKFGDEIRLFLDDGSYKAAICRKERKEIKIRKYAHVIEGHIIEFKPNKRKKAKKKSNRKSSI